MNQEVTQRKAVVLISGGLDSMLAAKLLLEQGIHVEGLNFYTGFCHSGHTSAIRKQHRTKPKRNDALWVAEQLGIKLHIIDVVEEYKDVLINPKYGYGKNVNPCLDCKIFMVRKAKEWMLENHFDFIATGEVIGQRPKSQRKQTMPLVAKHSGSDDRLLRPLCAKLLEPTFPEREGWVDRQKLLAINGRGRKTQLDLSKQHGFVDHAQPAGGCCVLTDENYARKLEDFWQHRQDKDYGLEDIILLKIGRHLRLNEKVKLIMGREEGENNFLEGFRKRFIYLRLPDHDGPLALIDGDPSLEDIQLAATIVGRFSSARDMKEISVEIGKPNQILEKMTVTPLPQEGMQQAWYI